MSSSFYMLFFFFFQAEDGIRDLTVTGVQTCALPISFAGAVPYLRDAAQARCHRHPHHRLMQAPREMHMDAQQRKANLRLALILVSVALVFLAGFVIKITVLH